MNVVSLRLCSFGAMLTSVFVVNNPAFPFDAGSRLATLTFSFQKTNNNNTGISLTYSESDACSTQNPYINFLSDLSYSDLREQCRFDM